MMKPDHRDIGLDMFKFDLSGHTNYGHTGGIDGFFTEACYFPKEKVAIAYCSIGGAYLGSEVLSSVMKIYFNLPYTIPTFNINRLDAAKLTPYPGYLLPAGIYL
jgi:D-alanyl-D-alanine carboxypeptidase